MSLQGTLSTLGITELLEFLAGRSSSGQLDVTTGSGSTSYLLVNGSIGAAEFHFTRGTGTDPAEGTYYVLSELDGHFYFEEQDVSGVAEGDDVDTLLGNTAEVAERWHEVEVVIPTISHVLIRNNELDSSVTIEPEWWKTLEILGAGQSTSQISQLLNLGILDAATQALGMVNAGLLLVSDEQIPTESAAMSSAPAVSLLDAVSEDVVVDASPEDVALDEPVLDEPALDEVRLDELVFDETSLEEPVLDEPAFDEMIDDPALDEPILGDMVGEPAIEEPALEELAMEEPALDEPAFDEMIDHPALDEPATIDAGFDVPLEEASIDEPLFSEQMSEDQPFDSPSGDFGETAFTEVEPAEVAPEQVEPVSIEAITEEPEVIEPLTFEPPVAVEPDALEHAPAPPIMATPAPAVSTPEPVADAPVVDDVAAAPAEAAPAPTEAPVPENDGWSTNEFYQQPVEPSVAAVEPQTVTEPIAVMSDAPAFETQSFETQSFETQSFETPSFETQPFETQPFEPQAAEPVAAADANSLYGLDAPFSDPTHAPAVDSNAMAGEVMNDLDFLNNDLDAQLPAPAPAAAPMMDLPAPAPAPPAPAAVPAPPAPTGAPMMDIPAPAPQVMQAAAMPAQASPIGDVDPFGSLSDLVVDDETASEDRGSVLKFLRRD